MVLAGRYLFAALLVIGAWQATLDAQETEPVEEGSAAESQDEPLATEDVGESWTLQSLVVDYEVGALGILQNDGRYGADGTEYAAEDVGQKDNLVVAQRISLEFPVVPRHTFILLYAPLDVTSRVTLDAPLRFRDETFAADAVVDYRYLFDGYRLSYLYGAVRSAIGLHLDVGASFQIRNANVSFSTVDGSQFAKETDIGLVFALKARLRWDSPWGPFAVFDFDGFSTFGLAGDVTGGIYDAALTLGLPVADWLDLFLRARAVGGGADVPDRTIYNWAHFLSFSAGVRIELAELF